LISLKSNIGKLRLNVTEMGTCCSELHSVRARPFISSSMFMSGERIGIESGNLSMENKSSALRLLGCVTMKSCLYMTP